MSANPCLLVLTCDRYGTLMFRYLTPFQAVCYFCSSQVCPLPVPSAPLQRRMKSDLCHPVRVQMICGLFLALVFGLGHNGMAVYDADKRPDFWKLQVTTTRNVKGGAFVQWFCGGLGYQVRTSVSLGVSCERRLLVRQRTKQVSVSGFSA